MSYYTPTPYDATRRRQRRRQQQQHPGVSPLLRTASHVATTAIVAYGVYHVGRLAWNAYFGSNHEDDAANTTNNNNNNNATEDGDLLYEWCEDSNGARGHTSNHDFDNDNDNEGEEETANDYFESNSENHTDDGNATDDADGKESGSHARVLQRSRRSRLDWSEKNHERRSHRPSPSHQHHHHDHYNDDHNNDHNDSGNQLIQSNQQQQILDNNDASTDIPGLNTTTGGILSRGLSKAASFASAKVATVIFNAALNTNNNSNNNFTTTITSPTISPFLRNARLGRCRVEISRAMIDFLPTIKSAVGKETEVSKEIMEELKSLRKGRRRRNTSSSSTEEIDSNNNNNSSRSRERERYLW